ncbi:MAG: glycoside hydrolase family 2 protein [Lachnospiraceae bacterium]|jgi:beta-galactosidase|nr:glycoside hydrolase family 2 protein [Lachnospiraceae bacterium]MCH4071042.1 glycoside hydrolase family 2 protein [Lachnospiraceae bacterium]MCH4108113.1 glycoside hydrolase family 2 protein [Lachnospiraceae bacterium]MCI1331916.1 glycoside hydrolase family 2 protein [Lachnospiraceae bacterium]MCI1360676.1 glycoside hydrolase family 2 protein [Lachnospiraceae bacterium]
MRRKLSWNTGWYFAKTSEIPDGIPEGWESVTLPHTWNAKDGQDGGDDYWRGTACYVKAFEKPDLTDGGRAVLELEGAAMTASVYLNGVKLARHEGGYAAFRVDLTDHLNNTGNLLCVLVDNGKNDRVYPQKADFTFYGGLYRSVSLILVPADHFELIKDGTPGIRVTTDVSLEERRACVKAEAWTCGGDCVTFAIADQSVTCPVADGYACAKLTLTDVRLWNGKADPYLYTASARLIKDGVCQDEVSVRFGCRVTKFDPQRGFILNGKEYPLRGVSRHQDRAGAGNALRDEDHRQDMDFIREIGANMVRLAHYQQAQEFYDLCDEYGIVVWAEIPYITCHMPDGRNNTLTQMRELITQCFHHPSIVCWCISNEITASGQISGDLMDNHRLLNDLCHRMDPGRPTVMAHAFMLEPEDPLTRLSDLAGYNLYFGWYLGEPAQNDSFLDSFHAKYPDRCLGLSEYGADANPKYQSSHPERGDYSEQYQCLYHEHMLQCIEDRPWLWMSSVWNLFDFAADGRDEGGNHGVNQKGLVTMDRRLKKDAFYLYKAAWSKEPFVHICGRRYVNRCEDETEIKVYSNCGRIGLFVDGKPFAARDGKRIFVFRVPICGEHQITARCGGLSDTITVKRADSPDAGYVLSGRKSIVNWFDREVFREDCYSIRDTFGDLMGNPDTAALTGALMKKIRASRGEVAESASKNPALQKMLAGMRFESLLSQAGPAVSGQEIRAFNESLQKIPKNGR